MRETPDAFSVTFEGERPSGSRGVYQALSVDRTWSSGILYLLGSPTGPALQPFPVGYPLEQFLFVSLLAHSVGAVVHGTGVILDGRGFVFAGTHGAGKSTLASIFLRHGVELLNDDRVVLRRLDGGWRLFGSPWAGTVRQVSPASAPLGGVFLIRHGSATRAVPLSASQSAPRLLARCLHPYWDREGLAALLMAVNWLVREVPCYDFSFVPEPEPVLNALDSVRDL